MGLYVAYYIKIIYINMKFDRRMASSAVSSISQDSTAPSTTSLALDNSVDTTVSLGQPITTNYEHVAYTDSGIVDYIISN